MLTENLTPQTTLANLFSRWPQTIPIFIRRRLSCVGCAMAAFDTLAEVAHNYNLPLDGFLIELHAAITSILTAGE